MARACRCGGEPLAAGLCAGLAALGLAALLAPEAVLRVAPPCLITLLTGHECWGCGITRAILSALRGDFRQAWQLNPGVVVVLPLLLLEYARFVRRTLRALRSR